MEVFESLDWRVGESGGSLEDKSWLNGLRTDGGDVFHHSGRWIVIGMRGQKDRNRLLSGCWLSSIWMNRAD